MENRVMVSLSLFVDLKVDEGADVRDIINGLSCACKDTTGEAKVVSVEITDRSLVVEDEEETDAG